MSCDSVYLVRMPRGWVYLAVVLAAGLATGLWFVMTEEVDPAATEPGAFDLFLMVFSAAAMVGERHTKGRSASIESVGVFRAMPAPIARSFQPDPSRNSFAIT